MNEMETLESMVQKPRKVKKPGNWALWFAFSFFNVGILVFDIVASITVYHLTKNIGYSIITFLAGFIPLIMHEALYVRAYASRVQRTIAIGGATISFLTVVVVAILAALVNLATSSGYTINAQVSEIVLLLIVVSVALLHVALAAFYFYSDEGVRAEHTEAENVAFFNHRMGNLLRAEQLLEQADKARHRKAQIINRHGGSDGKAALDYLLNLLNDDDGDGIPNILDRVDNRKQKPVQTGQQEAQKERVNGNEKQDFR